MSFKANHFNCLPLGALRLSPWCLQGAVSPVTLHHHAAPLLPWLSQRFMMSSAAVDASDLLLNIHHASHPAPFIPNQKTGEVWKPKSTGGEVERWRDRPCSQPFAYSVLTSQIRPVTLPVSIMRDDPSKACQCQSTDETSHLRNAEICTPMGSLESTFQGAATS